MAKSVLIEDFNSAHEETARQLFRHDDGREWSPEEIATVNEAFVSTNAKLRRLIERMDVQIAQKESILRELRECRQILETSNEHSRQRALAKRGNDSNADATLRSAIHDYLSCLNIETERNRLTR